MIQNPINAFKITIYTTKHTRNTKTTFKTSKKIENIEKHIFEQKNQSEQRFMLVFTALFIICIILYICTMYLFIMLKAPLSISMV